MIYKCEICGREDKDITVIEACEAQTIDTPLMAEIGDIVITETYGRFGWFDGDSDWVIERGKDPTWQKMMVSLIYVVTDIKVVNHRRRYYVATKAMTGTDGYRGGFTHDSGHDKLTKLENPPELDFEDLIGIRIENLL